LSIPLLKTIDHFNILSKIKRLTKLYFNSIINMKIKGDITL
jgi:hypothetical protein